MDKLSQGFNQAINNILSNLKRILNLDGLVKMNKKQTILLLSMLLLLLFFFSCPLPGFLYAFGLRKERVNIVCVILGLLCFIGMLKETKGEVKKYIKKYEKNNKKNE